MNTGQVLMILGALMLLSMVTFSVNSLIVSKTFSMLQSEAHLTAISVAQSMIDEIMTCAFDSAVVGSSPRVWDSTKFTPPDRLGPETSCPAPSVNEVALVPRPEAPDTTVPYKSITAYNDIDDYNYYKRYYYSPALGLFTVCDTVYYVQEANPEVRSTKQTFFKKVVVTVRHMNLCPPGVSFTPWTGDSYLQLTDVAVYRRYY